MDLPKTTFIFVDRRQTGRGKSLNNRTKLLHRIKESIRQAKPEDLDTGGVAGAHQHGAKNQSNPVKIARHALHEPVFHYDSASGEREAVLVGNDEWERGDEFPVSSGGGKGSGKGQAGQGGDGEDDFIVNISRSEFFDVFFEDCELPDLKETSEKELPEAIWKPAGFQMDGNASQLAVIRSFKNSIGRRRALTADDRAEIEQLEEQLALVEEFLQGNPLSGSYEAKRRELVARIDELRAKMASVPFFEKLDLRFRKSERIQVKSAEAVLVMVMDISGSMDEEKKTIARRFFVLQYAFIQKKYPNTDLIFIAHTDEAEELTEEEFFTTRKSGGTTVSSGLKLANELITARYDVDQTNIYLSYAGDGDNWDNDNASVIAELEERGLLSKLRHAVYSQVGHSFASGFGSGPNLWNVMQSVSNSNKKLHVVKIPDAEEVYAQFKKVYKKAKAS